MPSLTFKGAFFPGAFSTRQERLGRLPDVAAIRGMKVYRTEDTKLWSVEDGIVDAQSGELRYLVVNAGCLPVSFDIRAAISCCRNRRTRYIDNFVTSTTSSSERPCSSILRARSTCWCDVLNVLAKWATVSKAGDPLISYKPRLSAFAAEGRHRRAPRAKQHRLLRRLRTR